MDEWEEPTDVEATESSAAWVATGVPTGLSLISCVWILLVFVSHVLDALSQAVTFLQIDVSATAHRRAQRLDAKRFEKQLRKGSGRMG